jgi:penicillin-binding protein 1A
MMTQCLQAVVQGGTGSSIRQWFNYPAAGKTGTTQSYADAWFVGYTPHFVAGAWVGFDDKRVTFTTADGQGGRAAAPIWGRFMKYAYQSLKPKIRYFNTNWSGAIYPRSDSTAPGSTDSITKQIQPIDPRPPGYEPPADPDKNKKG